MKKNQKGFSAVEGLFVLLIVGVVGVLGWYIYQQSQKFDTSDKQTSTANTTSTTETYKRTTTVPSNWKTYSNTDFKFSLSYPQNWTVRGESVEGELTGSIYPDASTNPQGNPQYSFYTIPNKPLEDIATEERKDAKDSTSIRMTITSDKTFSIDGHKAVRIDTTSDDGTEPDSYGTKFYISANGKVYVFDTGFHDKDAIKDKDVLTIFESIKIQ